MAMFTAGPATYDVYVANLPVDYNENQIRDIFDVAGEIAGVKIIPGKAGVPGKVAFVKFLKEADAQCVAQYMSNFQLADGRNLHVNYRPSQNSQKSTPAISNPMLKAAVNTSGKVDEPVVNGIDKKVDETLVLYVSDVSSPLEFSAHLYNKELASELDKLTRSMEAVCPSQPKVVGQLLDVVYGCKFSLDEMWYRCRVMRCLPKNEIEVRYIDYGNAEIINRFALVELPKELGELSPLCDQYVLDDLELVDRDVSSELYMKGLGLFNAIIGEQRVEVKVMKKEAPHACRVKLMKVLDSSYSETFREKMISTGAVKVKMPGKVTPKTAKSPAMGKPSSMMSPTAIKTPTIARPSAALKTSSPSPSPSSVVTPLTVKSPVKLTSPPPTPTKESTLVSNPPSVKSISPISVQSSDKEDVFVPEKDEFEVYVSHIESPLEFWGQVFDSELEVKLLTLTANLEDMCPSQRKITSSDPPDAIYGCQFSQDGLWYRCKIEETINNTEVHVRYVDYGNSEITLKSGLVVLPPEISSMEGLCNQYKIDGLELSSKESTSESFRMGIHTLQVLIGEQKIHVHGLKIEYGTHIVHIDKVADEPCDVGAELIAKGVASAKKIKQTVKTKPPKVKRMIFTADDADEVEDNLSSPVLVPNTTTNEKDTYADKMIKIMATKVKSIRPLKSNEPMVNGNETPISTDDEVVISASPSAKKETELTSEKTLDKYVKEIEEKRIEVAELQRQLQLAEKTSTLTVDASSSTEIATTRAVETNTLYMAMEDAQTNTLPAIPKPVETARDRNASHTSSPVGSLDQYMREIEEKRKEVEDLKVKLQEKTKLVDDYLKKIPTPGCKRDLYQLYDDDAYLEEERDDKFSVQDSKEEKVSLNDIGAYKKEIGELRGLLEAPLLHKELFEDVGVTPAHGILVHGPRGCGKTTIARAVANDVKAFVVELQCSSLMDRPIAELQNILTNAFTEAERNPPSIILIDELDKLAPRNPTDKSAIIVSLIVKLWSMLKRKGQCILLATVNNDIDPSLKGYGMFERGIKIPVPDRQHRLAILSILTKKMNLHTDVSLKNIADQTGGFVASDLSTLCNIAGMQVIRRKLANMQIKSGKGFLLDKASTSSASALPSSICSSLRMQDFKHALSVTKPSVPKIYEIPDITWSHIGGLLDVKSDLKNFIRYSTEHSGEFKQYGICPPKGVLLHGPQGCGKRTLAKAFANQCKYNFVNVEGRELLAILTSDAKRNEFSAKVENAMPCVVFIKNIDYITKGRGYKFGEFFSMFDRLVLKNEMFVIGSATSIDSVHPSFKIEGRLDHVVHVPVPDEDSRMAILEMKLNKISKSYDVNVKEIAESTEGLSGRELLEICDKVCKRAIIESIDNQRCKKERDGEDDKGKLHNAPRLTMEHFSKILELAEEKTTVVQDRSCVQQKDVTALNNETDTSLYLTQVIEKLLAEKTINDAMQELCMERDVHRPCGDRNQSHDANDSQVTLCSQVDTSLKLNQFMEDLEENSVRETIIKDAMRESGTEINLLEACGNVHEITTDNVMVEVSEEKEIVLEDTGDILFRTYNGQEEAGYDAKKSEESFSRESQEICVSDQYEGTSYVNIAIENGNEEVVCDVEQPQGTSYVNIVIENKDKDVHEVKQPEEIHDAVDSNCIDLEANKESGQPVGDPTNPEEVDEQQSDSEKDVLNESFESCDSNLSDECTLNGDEDTVPLSNVDTEVVISHDEPSFKDGDEIEGWSAALENKKTREPKDIPIVEYEDEKGEFF